MKYFHFHFRFELNAIKRKVFFVFFLYEFEYIKCNYIFYSQTSLRVLFFHLTWPLSVVSIGFSFLFVVCVFFLRVCVLLLVCVNVSQFLFRASIRPNRKKKILYQKLLHTNENVWFFAPSFVFIRWFHVSSSFKMYNYKCNVFG